MKHTLIPVSELIRLQEIEKKYKEIESKIAEFYPKHNNMILTEEEILKLHQQMMIRPINEMTNEWKKRMEDFADAFIRNNEDKSLCKQYYRHLNTFMSGAICAFIDLKS